MGKDWGVSSADSSCDSRPKPSHNCPALQAAHGLPPATVTKIEKFVSLTAGKKTRLSAPFYTKNDHFAKTGSGQT
jgi:hypothetical protein